MSEKRILLGGGAVFLVVGLFLLPGWIQKQKEAPGISAFNMPGPRVADPLSASTSVSPESAPAAAPTAAAAPATSAVDGNARSIEAPDPAATPANHPSSEDPGSFVELGNMYLQQENYTAAISSFRRYLEKNEDPQVLTSLAIALRQTGQVDEALEVLRRSLTISPDGLESRYYLGVIQQYDLGDFDAAIATFSQVLDRLPPEHRAELEKNLGYMRRVREKLLKNAGPAPEVPSAPAGVQTPAVPASPDSSATPALATSPAEASVASPATPLAAESPVQSPDSTAPTPAPPAAAQPTAEPAAPQPQPTAEPAAPQPQPTAEPAAPQPQPTAEPAVEPTPAAPAAQPTPVSAAPTTSQQPPAPQQPSTDPGSPTPQAPPTWP